MSLDTEEQLHRYDILAKRLRKQLDNTARVRQKTIGARVAHKQDARHQAAVHAAQLAYRWYTEALYALKTTNAQAMVEHLPKLVSLRQHLRDHHTKAQERLHGALSRFEIDKRQVSIELAARDVAILNELIVQVRHLAGDAAARQGGIEPRPDGEAAGK